ncbi:MAG: PTS sugar transporter subunit IIA [Myxococcales bacterium]|nr:PTS sugar transporter subunit IIA [Myxococcales bacterium]
MRLSREAEDKPSVLREISRLFAADDPSLPEDEVYRVLMARESLASTGVGSGVAIPHGRVAGLDQIRAALLVHGEGVPFDAVDGERVQVFVAILAPEDKPSQHLRVLAEVSRLLRRREVRERLVSAESIADILDVVR